MLENLIPPGEKRLVTWRWLMAIAIGLLVANGIAGRGFLFKGVGQFASAADMANQAAKVNDDIAALSRKIDKGLALQIAGTLRDLKKEECRANGNKRVIRSTIEEYQAEYLALTGLRYPLDDCGHQ